jgi:hypothetical protein
VVQVSCLGAGAAHPRGLCKEHEDWCVRGWHRIVMLVRI